eukprot:TRINITY_DN926_c0_g1_i2.p1 TRINITY_DN926_c0_g1~~TRINITY_DN926_c0_g1_i2.p1  ORF type:complete len:264 (+),score=29.83 TRINITY_DN926_c0_g1_i2:174-965(+)
MRFCGRTCGLVLLIAPFARGVRQRAPAAPAITNAAPKEDGATTGGRLSGGRGLNLGSKIHVPKVTVDETAVESDDEDHRDAQRKGRWTFVDDADPVVSVIKSVKDLFPHVSLSCEPTTTLKLRKIFTPLKTVVTLGADYNTNIGVWQFRSSWEDSIIGGRISVAGRELMLSKSWLIKVMDSEDVATRLKFKAAVNTKDWTAYAKFGLRTERIAPLNVREGFTLCRRLPLDGNRGEDGQQPVCILLPPRHHDIVHLHVLEYGVR